MATIPRLNRIEPSSAMPKNDRIDMQVNDQASKILSTTKTVTAFGELGAEIYQNYEDEKIEQLSTEAESEFRDWNDKELGRLKAHKGDPTDAYVEYDKKVLEKREEILSKRPDLNDRVKRHFTSKFDTAIEKHTIGSMKQRGMQQEVYANTVFENGIKSKKDDLAKTAGYIEVGNPDSYQMFDDNLRDIKNSIVKRGLTQGTVTKLPDDAEKWSHKIPNPDDPTKEIKVSMTDTAKLRFAKEASEGIRTSVEVMLATDGQREAAKEVFEKYKGFLAPSDIPKLQKKFETVGRKEEAYNVIESLKGKPPEIQIEKIDAIKDPELRSEALKIKDADDRRIENLRDRKAKRNYETLAGQVMQKMNSDQPYFGIADLENDPVYKHTWDNLKPKQQKAIMEMVEAPKESNPKSELRVQNLFFGTDDKSIETITPEEFAEYTVGLSKSDKAKYTQKFMSLRSQSEGEKRSMYNDAGRMLRDQFIADGHIRRNTYGKIAGEDEEILIRAQNKLMEHLGNQYGTFRPEQLQKFVKDFSVAEIKGKVFNPQPRRSSASATKDQSKFEMPEGEELTRLKREFRTVNKYFPPSTDLKFIEFVKRNRK